MFFSGMLTLSRADSDIKRSSTGLVRAFLPGVAGGRRWGGASGPVLVLGDINTDSLFSGGGGASLAAGGMKRPGPRRSAPFGANAFQD